MPGPDRTPQQITDEQEACTTTPNGTGIRCTCRDLCANWWLRAAGFKAEDPHWPRPQVRAGKKGER